MKILLIQLYRHNSSKPVALAKAQDLSQFNFFTRTSVEEHFRFFTRTIVGKAKKGSRQTIEMKDVPYVCHSYVRNDSLSGVVVTDREYPQRVAFTIINKMMQDFEKVSQGKWAIIEEDQNLEPSFMKKALVAYQDPEEADKLKKIQKDLDEIKDVMSQNIEAVLQRGENLEALMDKSDDLSSTSVNFYKRAKKTNSCCGY